MRERFRNPIEARELAQHFVPLGARLELLRVERALARKARRLEQRREMPRPFGRASLGGFFPEKKRPFQRLPQKRAWLGEGDQSGEGERRLEVPAQAHIERRAPRPLGLGAGKERRAEEPAGPRKIGRLKRNCNGGKGGVGR